MFQFDDFNKYFSVGLAASSEQQRAAFKIRYKVYCQEFDYLPACAGDTEGDFLEYDEFDQRSLHCLVTHKSSNLTAGCVRLVTTQQSMYEDPLPLEKYCLQSLSIEALERLSENRAEVAEISRLAVDPVFRRRSGKPQTQLDGTSCHYEISPAERRFFPHIGTVALMAAAAVTELIGRSSVFAMMDPLLPKKLRYSGFMFERAGSDIDYHGKRAPYSLTVESFHKNIPDRFRSFYYDIYHRLDNESRKVLNLESIGTGNVKTSV